MLGRCSRSMLSVVGGGGTGVHTQCSVFRGRRGCRRVKAHGHHDRGILTGVVSALHTRKAFQEGWVHHTPTGCRAVCRGAERSIPTRFAHDVRHPQLEIVQETNGRGESAVRQRNVRLRLEHTLVAEGGRVEVPAPGSVMRTILQESFNH